MLALRRAGFGVDHDVRRDDFADALLDGIAERMHLFEAGSTSDANRGIHKVPVTGAADAHAVNVQDSFHAAHRHGDFLLQTLGGDIQERIEGSLPELRADPRNNGGDGDAWKSAGVSKPGQVPGFAGPDEADSA